MSCLTNVKPLPKQLDPDMKVFIERTVSAWKFDATVDTDACQGDAAPATANPPRHPALS